MATINAAGSDNRVNRMRMSKSRTLLLYSAPAAGAALLVSRLAVSELKVTNPFTIA